MSSFDDVSRRQVLQIVGVASVGVVGAGALAGCSPGTTDDPNAPNNGGGAGEIHVGYPYTAPPEGNHNLYGTAAIVEGSPYGDMLHMPSCHYLWDSGEWVNLLAESFSLDEAANTYTIKVKSGLTWSDGAAITAKDYVTTFYCAWLLGQPVWKYVKGIEATDDSTFVMTLENPSTVLERYILKAKVADSQTYGAIATKAGELQKAGKARDSAEGAALLAELQKLQPAAPIVSGPFMIDLKSITNTQLTMVKNPKGYAVDKVKFDKVVVYNGETPEVTPLVQNKTVDYATHGFPPSSEKAFIAAGIRIIRPPNLSGPALFFNMEKYPEFKDKRVRQAFACVIDRSINGQVSLAESGKGVEFLAGFADGQLDAWTPSGTKDKLKKYAVSTDEATKLLNAAGWKKSGDTWTKPDGKPAAWEISFPAQYADWSASGKNVAEQLSAFGLKVTPRGVDFAQQPIDVDKGNFMLAIQGWGASTQPHPYFAYVADLITHNIPIAKNQGGKGMAYELGAVPNPAGGTVNLEELITKCGEGLDLEAQKTQIATLATIFNEELPIIPLYERYGNNACLEGTRVKAFPADGSPILKNPVYADNFVVMGMLDGTIVPA